MILWNKATFRTILRCTTNPHLKVQKSTVKNQNDLLLALSVGHTESEWETKNLSYCTVNPDIEQEMVISILTCKVQIQNGQ